MYKCLNRLVANNTLQIYLSIQVSIKSLVYRNDLWRFTFDYKNPLCTVMTLTFFPWLMEKLRIKWMKKKLLVIWWLFPNWSLAVLKKYWTLKILLNQNSKNEGELIKLDLFGTWFIQETMQEKLYAGKTPPHN